MTTPVFLYISYEKPDLQKASAFLLNQKVLCVDGLLGDGWLGCAETPETESVLNGRLPISALIKPSQLENWDMVAGMNHQLKFNMLDEFQKQDLWDDLSILKKHYQSIVIVVPPSIAEFSFYLKQKIQGLLLDVPAEMTGAVEMLQLLKTLGKKYQANVFFMTTAADQKMMLDFLKAKMEQCPRLTCSFNQRYAL